MSFEQSTYPGFKVVRLDSTIPGGWRIVASCRTRVQARAEKAMRSGCEIFTTDELYALRIAAISEMEARS